MMVHTFSTEPGRQKRRQISEFTSLLYTVNSRPAKGYEVRPYLKKKRKCTRKPITLYVNSKNSEAKDKVPINRKKMFKMGNKKGICSVVELRMGGS